MLSKLAGLFMHDLPDFIFPRACIVCGRTLHRDEDEVCSTCVASLPFTIPDDDKDSIAELRLAGKFDFERAAFLLEYAPATPVQKIVESFKYHGNERLAIAMGRIMAARMERKHFFDSIDFIIPVPLHREKQKERGYNQSEDIAKGISSVTGLPVRTDIMERVHNDGSQTARSAFDRADAALGAFRKTAAGELQGKHCLLVDDVLTTGATLTGCAAALSGSGLKISVLTLTGVV